MVRLFTGLMLASATAGLVLCVTASATLALAAGLLMLMVGAGGLTAVSMTHLERPTPDSGKKGRAGKK
ncbi:hypothetical protein QF050_003113 [Arthrobacter sp. SLBN-112]|nr:hypothetical protein [Arthrobacter sp. SLBN-112]